MKFRTKKKRTGTAAVELAVCLPLMLILISGVWEVGRMVSAQQIVANAAREGGRELAAGQTSVATVQSYVVNYMTMNGLTSADATMVTITNITNSGRADPTTCNQLDQWRVTVTVPYSTIRWSTIAQITKAASLTASADWYSMRDSTLAVDAIIPTN
jgi:Flp pilus assembly protein TadG